MAIAQNHITFFLELRKQGVVTGSNTKSIMEIGEQNWYGDVAPTEIHSVIDICIEDRLHNRALHKQLDAMLEGPGEQHLWDIAKVFYKAIFEYQTIDAIDQHGTPSAINHDMNTPFEITRQYDLLINGGTAEHIFNQYQVFKTIHELTKPGGLMIHFLPHQGHHDHGLYNYHPTFAFDLAQANNYEVMCLLLSDAAEPASEMKNIDRASYAQMAVNQQLGNQLGLVALFKKSAQEREFTTPQQGYYSENFSPDLGAAWKVLTNPETSPEKMVESA